jgi:hypothetical protein
MNKEHVKNREENKLRATLKLSAEGEGGRGGTGGEKGKERRKKISPE